MDRSTAKRVVGLMLEVGRKLDASVEYVAETEDEAYLSDYRKTVGKLMGSVLLDVLNPIFGEHPDLKPPELH